MTSISKNKWSKENLKWSKSKIKRIRNFFKWRETTCKISLSCSMTWMFKKFFFLMKKFNKKPIKRQEKFMLWVIDLKEWLGQKMKSILLRLELKRMPPLRLWKPKPSRRKWHLMLRWLSPTWKHLLKLDLMLLKLNQKLYLKRPKLSLKTLWMLKALETMRLDWNFKKFWENYLRNVAWSLLERMVNRFLSTTLESFKTSKIWTSKRNEKSLIK